MYSFRESMDSEFDMEEDASRSYPVRRAIPPTPMDLGDDLSLSPESLDVMNAYETIPVPSGGSRVVSFPPYATLAPIGLGAPTMVPDLSDTHRPTGDTQVPIIEDATRPTLTLEGHFSPGTEADGASPCRDSDRSTSMVLTASTDNALPTYPSPPPAPEGNSEHPSRATACPVISCMRIRAASDAPGREADR